MSAYAYEYPLKGAIKADFRCRRAWIYRFARITTINGHSGDVLVRIFNNTSVLAVRSFCRIRRREAYQERWNVNVEPTLIIQHAITEGKGVLSITTRITGQSAELMQWLEHAFTTKRVKTRIWSFTRSCAKEVLYSVGRTNHHPSPSDSRTKTVAKYLDPFLRTWLTYVRGQSNRHSFIHLATTNRHSFLRLSSFQLVQRNSVPVLSVAEILAQI